MLDRVTLHECARTALELAEWAVPRIAAGSPGGDGVSVKAHAADWVTEVDRAIETHVREVLLERFPNHQVRGEEFGASRESPDGLAWHVDPVDGTTNFVHGIGWSSFSLGLADSAGPAVAVVADPYRGDTYHAIRGEGCWLNERPTRCPAGVALAGGVVLTELHSYRPWPGMDQMMRVLADHGCATRVMGSSALSLASVASGRGIATVLHAYSSWDALAGALIATESGATILDRHGRRAALPRDGLVAGAPELVDDVWRAWTSGTDAVLASPPLREAR